MTNETITNVTEQGRVEWVTEVIFRRDDQVLASTFTGEMYYSYAGPGRYQRALAFAQQLLDEGTVSMIRERQMVVAPLS